MRLSAFQRAKNHINCQGFLLVFSMKNQARPQSLWSLLHPGVEMRWEWDESGDNKLGELWRLRQELAQSQEVVYGKFYCGRATFFSKQTFCNLLCVKEAWNYQLQFPESKSILESLEMDSPLSTKQLKETTHLRGKLLEGTYARATRELWEKLLIVGMGEVDDGAFPSLAHGATPIVFEDLWIQAQSKDPADAMLELLELPEYDLLEGALLA